MRSFLIFKMADHWDVIAISALDDDQKLGTQQLLDNLVQSKRFREASTHYRVFTDAPKGVKIGGGGAMLSMIYQLYQEFGSELFTFRTLVLPASGYSQRQPNATILGKLFVPTPVEDEDDGVGKPLLLFQLKLRTYGFLLRRMEPGIFLASSDTLEYFGDTKSIEESQWSMGGDGFVALAHPSSLAVGRQHGVYVLDDDSRRRLAGSNVAVFEASCRRVLQKPSLDLMQREGAVVPNPEPTGDKEIVLTDSAYYVSSKLLGKLLEFYDELSPLAFELDAYGDFLQPLGSHATDDYLSNPAINALVQDDKLSAARRYLFESLRQVPLKVLVFSRSRFYHLGTFGELMGYFCPSQRLFPGIDGEEFQWNFGTKRFVLSLVEGSGAVDAGANFCVLTSRFRNLAMHQSTTALIEYCDFAGNLEFNVDGGRCILSHCSSTKDVVTIPASIFMTTIPIRVEKDLRYVTVVFGVNDDLKAVIDLDRVPDQPSDVSFSSLYLLDKTGDRREQVFDAQFPRTLWYARLFPSFQTRPQSFDWTLDWFDAVCHGRGTTTFLKQIEGASFYSMHDLLFRKDVGELLSWRSLLQERICILSILNRPTEISGIS